MTKPATVDDLSSEMERDITWRVRELSSLKLAIRSADAAGKDALLRALVAMIYAHWEGFIRFCAVKYFQHITIKRKSFEDLEDQIYINAFLSRLDAFHRSRGSLDEKCRFLTDVLNSQKLSFSRLNPSLIDTKSNLNSDVLKDICTICGVESSGFDDEADFIDTLLLKRRNAVAHGQTVDISVSEMDNLVERAIALMRQFRTLLENKAYQSGYLALSLPSGRD